MRCGLLVALLVASAPTAAQQIYQCSDGKGGGSIYQQTPCATQSATKGVRTFKREPDAPQTYSRSRRPVSTEQQQTSNFDRSDEGTLNQDMATQPLDGDPSGYVRCTKESGATYLRKGNSCRVRHVSVPHRAGMVTDITTGQQHYMIPGGGNGMIDPTTGKRVELISPPPTRRVQDAAQPAAKSEVCAQARAQMTDPDRTIDSIRAAEAMAAETCGG